MRCEQFEERLDQLLDERRSPCVDPSLAAHAAGCAGCRELLAGCGLLLGALPGLPRPAPSADLAEHVVARATARRPLVVWSGRRAALLAVAALLIVGLMPLVRRAAPPPQPTLPAAAADVAAGHAPIPLGRIALVSLPAISEREIKVLAHSTGERVALVVMHFPDYSPADGSDGGATRPAWIEPVADGLRPLAESVSGAWHVLRRTVPGATDTRL